MAEDPDRELEGELAKFHEEWQVRMARQKALEDEEAQIAKDVEALKDIARLSLNTDVNEKFEGEVLTKELELKVLEGSGEKSYKFMLERYVLTDKERKLSPIARWVIADIEEKA